MGTYRKKPVTVEAIKFDGTGNGHVVVEEWAEDLVNRGIGKRPPDRPAGGSVFWGDYQGIHITTLEGRMTAGAGDWIICGVQGEFYPIKDSIFCETYEAVSR